MTPTNQSVRAFLCAFLVLLSYSVKAAPYASGVTNNNGTIQFVMNEAGATVNVVFEDNTTNALGVLPKGAASFPLNGHTSYQIICTKTGNGTPALISSDTGAFNTWNSPRGVDVNKNAKLGHLFGRVYVGNSAVSTNRGWGLYTLNADQSDSALGKGTNASTQSIWLNSAVTGTGNKDGPYRLTVAADNSVYVTDASTNGATVWQFGPDFEYTNQVLGAIGQNAGVTAGIHGAPIGVFATGSTSTGDLVVYTADPGMAVPPATTQLGENTHVGDYNVLYRYDIGSGSLPWSSSPNFAVNIGLAGFPDSQILDLTVGNNGYIYGMFRRANLSDGNIQVWDSSGTRLFTSLQNNTDPFAVGNGAYAGVRVSPDGKFIATMTIQNNIYVANLVNGIPDMNTIINIPNTPTTSNARGLAFDAADNIYAISSGQGLLRVYSLGVTSTTITSNDWTGTNGSFQLYLPNVTASVTATTPTASQNYINSIPAGTPTPGVFTISLTTNHLAEPVTVAYTLGGTGVYGTNYTLNLGTDANGIVITTTNVTFPAGDYPGVGNWVANVLVTPTAIPLSGPTYTVTLRIAGGANYVTVAPVIGTVSIMNTGPQQLVLSAASSGTSMSRAVPGDYAQFIITRNGDLNGPGNSPGNVTPRSFTITNFTYSGTAAPFPTDFTAAAQKKTAPGTEVPVDGAPGITIAPGEVAITNVIGNPVAHSNLLVPPTNVTIIINLTNSATGTNLVSQDGYPYSVTTSSVTLTEIDNAVGPEVVVWSNPLTNSLDSTNWTLTFASTNLGTSTVLPVVITNYDNTTPALSGGSNNFSVAFGHPITADNVPQSAVMAANGWSNVLRMTVNKDFTWPAAGGVNVYPQGQKFQGNYALRFNMYLSIFSSAIDNPFIGNYPVEFATFGLNHYGTNCNWKPTTPVTAITGGSGITNSDGVWCAIDAATGSLTPADFDGFLGQALPNNSALEKVSNPASSQNGVFKHPPFPAQNATGGSPINKWVDVSLEVTRTTNVSLFVNRSQVLTSYGITNSYTNGTIMLGYLDPIANVSDNSAFVYYSNVRVVELSPAVTKNPTSLIVTQGSTVTFTSSAAFGSAPLTNIWYRGNTGPNLATALQTTITNATAFTNTFSLTNVTTGTNYFALFSDAAGSITSSVANLEVILGPTNATAAFGANVTLRVTPSGQAAPTSYQWKFNGTNLANSTHHAGVTTNALIITNAQAADVGTYSVTVVNAAGSVTPSATLTLANPPSGVTVTPAAQTNLWGSTATFTASASGTGPLSYRWKKNNVNMNNTGNVTGALTSTLTLANVTTTDAASYTVTVTNAVGTATSSNATLTVEIPPPTMSTVSMVDTNVVLSFSSTNIYDTTNAFILQSSPVVEGPYTNTSATFTTNNSGFEVTAPQSSTNMFYRLLHQN